MWNFVYGSAAGTSHQRTGQPCQDYCVGEVVAASIGPVLVAACADGAGSAALSGVGARIAVETFISQAREALMDLAADSPNIGRDVLLGWNKVARSRIHEEA